MASGWRFWRRETKAAEFSPQFIETIRAGLWPYGGFDAMYERQPAVRTVVDFLAANIASLNPKIYMRLSDTERQESDDHPLAELLRAPSPLSTRFWFMFDTVADKALHGRAYWVKVRDRGRVVALVRKAPAQLVRENQSGRPVWRDADGREFSRADLVIFRGYSPDGKTDGVSPLETLRKSLSEDWAAVINRENFWKNASRQSQWIKRPLEAPAWSHDARKRFRADMESTMTGGENAGRIGVLEEGMDTTGGSFSPKDSMYIEGRALTLAEVCRQYGGGALMSMMGAAQERETQSSTEERHRQGYQDVFAPWLKDLAQAIELQLLPDVQPFNRLARTYVEFNLDDKLKGSFEEQARVGTVTVGVPSVAVNEFRARLNLPRLDDEAFDVPVKPLNVLYGGQASTQVPTEDPGTTPLTLVPEAASLDIEAELRAFFAKQETQMRSALGRKVALDRWHWDRWDAELGAAIGNDGWARAINANTRKAVEDAPTLDGLGLIFADAQNGRAAFLAAELIRREA